MTGLIPRKILLLFWISPFFLVNMIQIAIIGAGGLTGRELISLSNHHPYIEIVHITSNKTAGKKISEIFPDVRYKKDLTFYNHEDPIPKEALIVLAVPNDVSLQLAPKFLDKGHKVIDLSGSYRLHNKELFKKYYNLEHTSFELMDKVVFGLPELYREKIRNAFFVSNPGCYSTSVIVPLHFLGNLIEDVLGAIVVDSKSGVSGAGGRTEEVGFSYTSVYENFRAYKILFHQHVPEMEEYAFADKKHAPRIVFTPHLLPVYRGILSTFVVQFKRDVTNEEIEKVKNSMRREKFIRVYNTPEEVEIRKVQNTNFVDIGMRLDKNVLVIVSALDNLVKGASGQAMQNINLMTNQKESLGLLSE